MIEWIQGLIAELNNYAGLFSLLAVLVAIIVPSIIYNKGKKDKRQDLQDELTSIEEASRLGWSMDEMNRVARKMYLNKRIRRK